MQARQGGRYLEQWYRGEVSRSKGNILILNLRRSPSSSCVEGHFVKWASLVVRWGLASANILSIQVMILALWRRHSKTTEEKSRRSESMNQNWYLLLSVVIPKAIAWIFVTLVQLAWIAARYLAIWESAEENSRLRFAYIASNVESIPYWGSLWKSN